MSHRDLKRPVESAMTTNQPLRDSDSHYIDTHRTEEQLNTARTEHRWARKLKALW